MNRMAPSFLALLLLTHSIPAGDNWPCWRGPTGQGITDEKGLPLTWGGASNENVLWRATLPGADGKARLDHNQSSPIVWKDRVFVMMVFWPEGVEQKEFPEHHVACYAAADGKKLWDATVPPGPWQLRDLRGGYSAPTPATDGERVYVLFGSSELVALDFDGKIVWRKPITPFGWDVAVGTSPFLYQDTILVKADTRTANVSRLIAFDKKTGDIKWEQKRPQAGWSHSTPLLIKVNGKPQLVVPTANALQGLDPANGKVLWWADNKGDVATPAFRDGLVYCDSGRGGPGIAVAPTGTGNVTETLVKWKGKHIPEGFASPIIAGNYIYRLHNPGILKCISLATGKVVYSERLPRGFNPAASPVLTPENRLYLAGGGTSLVLAVGPKFEVLATNTLDEAGAASPAVAGGRLYLKGTRYLYCIGKK